MDGVIEDVELAAGAIAYGLETNGIDTSILDTHNSKTTLSKPFGTEVEDFEKKIFAGRVGGGTPLKYTARFARNRMKRGGGKIPFMIIVTDGGAADKEGFKEEVRKANFPILGLYMSGRSSRQIQSQLDLYDKAVQCGPDSDVSQRLINLIRGVMF
jgi:hypothetical protein